MQHALAALEGLKNQTPARLKIASGMESAIPIQHLSVFDACCVGRLVRQRDDVGPWNAGEEQIDEPYEKFGVARGAGNHFRHPAQDVQTLLGVAVAHALQVLSTKRLFFQRQRLVALDASPLDDEGERRFTDDEMVARMNLKPSLFAAGDEDRIAGRVQPANFEFLTAQHDFAVVARNVSVPRHGPNAGIAAERRRRAFDQGPPPTLMRSRALSDQVGHVRKC
ncbi:MAG: hypothetical protein QM775_00845 [Pirellulales bacterium]